MPVIANLRVPLSVEDVMRAWGPRRAKLASPRMLVLVPELLERAETENWIQPAVSFRVWPIIQSGPGWMGLCNGSRLQARLLTHHLRAHRIWHWAYVPWGLRLRSASANGSR